MLVFNSAFYWYLKNAYLEYKVRALSVYILVIFVRRTDKIIGYMCSLSVKASYVVILVDLKSALHFAFAVVVGSVI